MATFFACMRLSGNVVPKSASLALAILLSPALLHADSVLNFPRLAANPDVLTGIAIVNPTAGDAQVTVTAYGSDGTPLDGAGVTNPATITVPANQQVTKLTFELFGSSLPVASAAWVQATSTTDGLTGFFLFLNSSITLMDGADLPTAAQKLIFNNIRIDSGYSTELDIVNPGSSEANLKIRLAGTFFPPAPQSLTIPARGSARLDAASFFSAGEVLPGAYVVVDSDTDVAGFELVNAPSGDAYGLNARRGGEQLGSLYFLQTSVLGSAQSFISLVNYSGDPVVLTITAYRTDGTLYDSSTLQNNPVTRALNPESSLREDIASMFGFFGDKSLEGWILIKSTSNAVNGFVSYGDTTTGAAAAITSPPEGQTRAIFSQIATSSGFSTVLSLLNPASLAANVRILALKKDGTVLGVFDTVLQPQQRFKGLMGGSDLIPQAANQSSGFIFVKSDIPVYMSALIGTNSAWVSIPSQPAPDTYNPDASIAALKMSPTIAIVPPGASQRFTVAGSPASLTWKVNGIAGGTPGVGQISSAGVFTAPKSVPAREVVTITAETASQSAGASADVLDKVPFLSGLSVLQSVTYLHTLGKVYSAELAALGSAPTAFAAAAPAGNSQIFEVSPLGAKSSVALFPGEVISKIIPFKADNGTEYILLAAQTSGRIIRLNPVTKGFDTVASGLNQPASIVIDPSSGDLLVVEQDKISTVPKSALQAGLSAPNGSRSSERRFAAFPSYPILVPQANGAGVAVDRCTGFVYYSLPDQGSIIQHHPAIGTSLLVATGLDNPGQLLGIYRADVTCPDSFHLLIAERGLGRVTLLVPQSGILTPWLDAPGITDLAFLPAGNPHTTHEAVLLGDYTLEHSGVIFIVPLSGLYDNKPANPPQEDLVEPKTDISVTQSHSPNPAVPYQNLAFVVTLTNKGPADATGVSLTDTPPASSTFLSVTSSQGNCNQVHNTANCSLGKLAAGQGATVTITVSPGYFGGTEPTTLRNTAAASSIEVDTVPSNNTSTEDALVSAPAAAEFVFSAIPASVVSGTPVAVTVTVKDQGGNVAANYTGRVRFTSTDSTAVLPGSYTFQASDAGSHSFLVTFRGSGPHALTAQDVSQANLKATGTTVILPAGFTLSSQSPNPAPDVPFTVTVTARDALGNPAQSYTGSAAFSSSDASATLPENYTFTLSDAGSHTFAGAFKLAHTGSQAIRIADTANPAIAGSMTFSVGVFQAVSLRVTAAPSSVVSGNSSIITVSALDGSGSVASGYTGRVRFSSADTSSIVGVDGPLLNGLTYQFLPSDNGTRSFEVYFYQAGSSLINVGDTGSATISGSVAVSVAAGSATRLAFDAPATSAAGTSILVKVAPVDDFGNVVTAYSGDVQFRISSAVEGEFFESLGVAGGVYSFQVQLVVAGSRTLVADGTGTPVLSNSTNVTITPLATAALEISGLPGSVGVDVPYNFQVTAFDRYGNVTPGYTGTVHFTSTDTSATLPADYQFVAADGGTHIFPVTFRTASCQAFAGLTAEDRAGAITAPSAVLIAGPAYTFSVLVSPSSPVAGVFADIQVTALDICGNTAVGFTGSIDFSTTDPHALPNEDSIYRFTLADAGVHNFTGTKGVEFAIAGRQTITVTGAVNPGIAVVDVLPGPAASLVLSAPLFPAQDPSGAPTSTFDVSVAAFDQFGNPATGYVGTIHFTSSDPAAVPSLPADYTFKAGEGVHVFRLTLPCNSTGMTITATDTQTGTITGITETIASCLVIP